MYVFVYLLLSHSNIPHTHSGTRMCKPHEDLDQVCFAYIICHHLDLCLAHSNCSISGHE